MYCLICFNLFRCGHVKLGDFGSCARLSEGGCVVGGTADYVAPELLSSDCTTAHTVCLEYCRRVNTAIVGSHVANAFCFM